MAVHCTCETCGKGFTVWASERKRGGGRYCSRQCRGQALVTSIDSICQQCGVSFQVQPHRIKADRGKFCSRNCQMAHRVAHASKEVRCPECGKSFVARNSALSRGKGKFCSAHCQYKAADRRVERNCEVCGALFKAARYMIERGASRFCSKHCMGQWMSEHRVRENAPVWNGGTSFVHYPPEFSKKFKGMIQERDAWVCAICRLPFKLAVHHIDYNRQHTVPENCISLCKDCHAQVHAGSKRDRPERRHYWQDVLTALATIRTRGTDNESECPRGT